MSDETETLNILVVTDDPAMPRELARLLADEGEIRTQFADTANAVTRICGEESVDMIVIRPSANDPDLIKTVMRAAREPRRPRPVIAVIEEDDGPSALAAARLGVEGMVLEGNERRLQHLCRFIIESIRTRYEAEQSTRRLEDIESRYTLLLDSSSEAIAYIHEGLYIYANNSYLGLFGYDDFDELEGLSMLDLFTASDEQVDLKDVLKSLARNEIPEEAFELQAHRQDGSNFKASVSFAPARYGGENCVQMLVREQVAHADPELEKELEKLKTRDLLTGLYNAQSFLKRMETELADSDNQRHLVLLLWSLDGHDQLLEKVGVAATDALISQSGELFKSAVPGNLPMARIRDHTFALMARAGAREAAEKLASRILEGCSGHIMDVRETSLTVSASIGLTIAGSNVTDAETLLTQADAALSQALSAGGNGFVRYRPRVSASAEADDAAWTERLQHALDNDELHLVTSAITSMEEDHVPINEVETRLRAEGSEEVLPPSVYLPAAARIGMAPRLDADMCRKLLKLAAERESDDEMYLLTLSMETLSSDKASAHIRKLVENSPLAPRQLIWGMRTGEISDRLRQAQQFISGFGKLGCRFALCDVTPGDDVDPLLKHLPVNYLRLGAESIDSISEDEDQRRLLERLSRTCGEHDVVIIAPRVDRTGDLATLWQLGITLVQGEFVRASASA